MRMRRHHGTVPLLLLLVAASFGAQAQDRALGGVVGTEALMTDSSGRLIWAAIEPDGTATDICPDPGYLSVMAAAEYRAAVAAFRALPEPKRVVTAADYNQLDFFNASNQPVEKPTLGPHTFTVVVRPPEAMRTPGDGLVLLESRIDLRNIDHVTESATALLLGPCTTCTCAAPPDSAKRVISEVGFGKIAYKTAFYIDSETGTGEQNLFRFTRGVESLLGPVRGATVDLVTGGLAIPGTSAADGAYVVRYSLPPSPCYPTIHDSLVTLELEFDTFDPQSGKPAIWGMAQPTVLMAGEPCQIGDYAFGQLPTVQMLTPTPVSIGTTVVNQHQVNFGLQVAMLTGQAVLRNEKRPLIALETPQVVAVGGPATTYDARRGTSTPGLPPADMDLDGDGQADVTQMVDGVVHVWLGGHTPGVDPPDVVRLPDRTPDLTDRGLVTAISNEDAEATDIFVYRLGTMQRIGARRASLDPTTPPVWNYNTPLETNATATAQGLKFDMLLQGPRGLHHAFGGYADWGAHTGMDRELITQASGHLTVGEPVKIFVINRATGYIGSAIATVGDNSTRLTFRPRDPIVMRPPNLRIRAERTFKPPFQERREDVLVGFEGAAMASDDYVRITSTWLDSDGNPLPADLPGFTGRLAKVISPNVLGPAAGVMAQFPITPGQQTIQVTLPEGQDDAAHFYVHVNAASPERNPDFAASGASEGRPARYVPFQVPVYNEAETWTQRKLAQQADEDDPGPVHSWVYRPEMQFSLLDLEMREMERTTADGQTVTVAMAESEAPVRFAFDDQSIDFLYTLLQDELPLLPQFGPERELVLAIGGQEIIATVGEDGSVTFSNPGSLTALDPEDLSTLRLYANGDDSNVLWEYAFLSAALLPSGRDAVIRVSADEPEVELHALVFDGDSSDSHDVRWETLAGGGAIIAPPGGTESGAQDVFNATLRVSTVLGSTTQVGFKIDDGLDLGGMVLMATTPVFETVAGAPAEVVLLPETVAGKTAIGEWGQVVFTVRVEDQWDNPVADTAVAVEAPDVRVERVGAPAGEEKLLVTDDEGLITLRIVGLDDPGTKQIQVRAGAAEMASPLPVQVHDVSLQWQLSASSVQVGQTLQATISATSSTLGEPLDGLKVHVSAHRAHARDAQLVIDGDSRASTVLTAAPHDGNGQVYARVANTSVFESFQVAYADGMQITNNVLVGDQPPGEADHVFDVSVGGQTAQVPFFTSTEVTFPGEEGDSIRLELGSTDFPLQEPVAIYPMQSLPGDTHVPEIYQGLAGTASGVELADDGPEGQPHSYRFHVGSEVTIDDAPELAIAEEVGLSIWIRPLSARGRLIDYLPFGMTVDLTSSGAVVVSATTSGSGPVSVSSLPLTMNEWHQVEASLRDGVLSVTVDGASAPRAAEGTLVRSGTPAHALRLGAGFDGFMAGFRVHDWARPALLEFAGSAPGGPTTETRTVDASGSVTFALNSTGAARPITALLMQRRIDRMYEPGPDGRLIKTAYAQDLAEVCGPAPAFEGAIDAALKLAEYLGQCNFLGAIKGAGIRLFKNGVFSVEGVVALRDLYTYTNLYAVVLGAQGIANAPECLAGFLLGDTSSTAGKACELISGFFVIGDIRDYIVQSFHLGANSDRCTEHTPEGASCYDPAVHVLSGLGIITAVATVAGAALGGFPGAIIGAAKLALNALKSAIKLLRPLGKLVDFVMNVLRKDVLDAPASLREKAVLLSRVMPFVEILAAIGFYHDEFAAVVPLLIDLASEPSNIFAMVEYAYAYFEWHYENIEVPGGAMLIGPAGLVAVAYAQFLRRPVVEKFIAIITEINGVASRYAFVRPGQKLAKAAAELSEILRRRPDDPDVQVPRNLIFGVVTLKAFFLAHKLGDDAAQGLRNYRRSSRIGHQKLYEFITELPENFYEGELGEGLRKVLRRIGSGRNFSNGYGFQVRALHYFHTLQRNIVGIEVDFEVLIAGGKRLGKRQYDLVMRNTDGSLEFHDQKSWDPNFIEERIQKQLGWQAESADEVTEVDKFVPAATAGADEAVEATRGALYLDIVKMYLTRRDATPHVVRWGFDARFAQAGKTSADVENMILSAVKDPSVKKRLIKDLGLNTAEDVRIFDNELPGLLRGFAYSIPD